MAPWCRQLASEYADKRPIIVTVSLQYTITQRQLCFKLATPPCYTEACGSPGCRHRHPSPLPALPPLQTLKGACIFMADLIRAIDPVPEGLGLGFIRASSYGAGTSSSGTVVLGISTLSDVDIKGRHLLLVSLFVLRAGLTALSTSGIR